MATTSLEPKVTGFELQGDQAYVTGFWSGNFGKSSMAIGSSFMIKENGKWKWFGNQGTSILSSKFNGWIPIAITFFRVLPVNQYRRPAPVDEIWSA